MSGRTMFPGETRDLFGVLAEIEDLARVGVASTDTVWAVDHLESAHRTLFEMIFRLAAEGCEMAEGPGK